MKTRIVTGFFFAVVLIGALWWHTWSWNVLICALAMIGLSELYKMAKINVWSPLSILGYIASFGILIGHVNVYLVILISFIASAMLSLRNQESYHIEKLAIFFFGLYYIVIGFYTSHVWYEEFGKSFVLYLLLLIWISDSAAYFVGYAFGKHKMAPVLSPKKTYEGLIGGVIATLVLSYFLNNWLQLDFSASYSLYVGIFVAIIAPIGDLFQSAIKRHFGVKDSGALLPGHGGVLDRFDAFLFVMIGYQFFFLFI